MFQRILVAYDGSEPAKQAVQGAAKLAKDQHAQLRIVSVVDLTPLYRRPYPGLDLGRIEQTVMQSTQEELVEAAAIAKQAGITPETVIARAGGQRVNDAIIAQAQSWPADLIVMGTHGRGGIERFVLGSVAEGVARGAPVPVLLYRTASSGRSS
ncbi:MAG TPA: universal stress protein [Chloroflexota bacterium]|nr:universal stress protein [Chloroflexota bacterium]